MRSPCNNQACRMVTVGNLCKALAASAVIVAAATAASQYLTVSWGTDVLNVVTALMGGGITYTIFRG